MSSPERAAAERIAKLYELAYPGVNEDLERIIREAYAGAAPQDMDAEWEEFCQTLGQEVMDDEQVAKLFAQRMLAKRGAAPDAELVRVLSDMVVIAREDDWHRATTGRQIVLASAERILKEHR